MTHHTHHPTCRWERTTIGECSYRETHHYCPHPEHACDCPPANTDVVRDFERLIDGAIRGPGSAETVCMSIDFAKQVVATARAGLADTERVDAMERDRSIALEVYSNTHILARDLIDGRRTRSGHGANDSQKASER